MSWALFLHKSPVMLNFGDLCQHPPITPLPPDSIAMVMAPHTLVTKHVIHSQALAVAPVPGFRRAFS